MGFFDGWRKKQSPDLTTMVADELRSRGFTPTVVSPDELTYPDAAGGTQRCYLDNLRKRLADVPTDSWAAEVTRFVGIMTSPPDSPANLEEVWDRIYPRILHRATFQGLPADAEEQVATAGIRLTDDLLVLPAIDHPDQVATELDVAKYGGWEAVWPVAIENLRRLPQPAYRRFDADDGDPAGAVHLFESEDFFGASQLLRMDELLAAAGLSLDLSNGYLVVLPARTVVAIHPVTSATGVVSAMKPLRYIAEADLPGGITDVVHYRAPDGTLEPVSRRDGADFTLTVTGRFEDAMRAIGAIG